MSLFDHHTTTTFHSAMSHHADLILLDRAALATVAAPAADAGYFRSHATQATRPRSAIDQLCRSLDDAFEESVQSGDNAEPSHRAAFARAVRAALASAIADATLLTAAQREGSVDSYRRHLLAADPLGRYAVAALVWMPGQMSPVHAHHTWCGYAVIEGTLTEKVFEWSEATQCASQVRTHPRASGAVSFTRAGRSGIHQLGNACNARAVSLHLYGVPGEQIATHVNDLLRVAAETAGAVDRTFA
jgi:predicted metal-dependent enzyme (double-stranded beta helix superfamily)